MKPSKFSKRQKQQIFTGILGVVVGSIVTNMFLLTPMKVKREKAKKTISELQTKVNAAERLIPGLAKARKDASDKGTELLAQTDVYFPIPGSEFAWAAGLIYSVGRQSGQEDIEVRDIGRTVRDPRYTSELQNPPFLQAYSARVITSGSFFQLKNFISALEEKNPYLTVSQLAITPRNDQPDHHDAEITLQWPVWGDAQFLKKIVSTGPSTP